MLRMILLMSVLYSARGSPARPTPFRYTFRADEVEFGNSGPGSEEQNSPYYEYHPYDGYVYGEYDNDSDESMSPLNIDELTDGLDICEENEDGLLIAEEGCIYFDNEGNVHVFKVFAEVDIEDAYKVVEKAGLEKCKMDGYKPLTTEDGCAYISEDGGVHLMGMYKNEKPEVLTDVIGEVQPCGISEGELQVPPEGCVWFDDERNIHLFNVLDDGNREDALRVLYNSKLFHECVLGGFPPIVPDGGCVFLDGSSIHILGMQEHYTTPNDDEEGVDYYDSDEDDEKVEKVVGRTTAKRNNLKQVLFNRRRDALTKTDKTATQKRSNWVKKLTKLNEKRKQRSKQNTKRRMKLDLDSD